MNGLKRYFILPYLLALLFAALHSCVQLIADSANRLAWAGSALALWPILLFFAYLGLAGRGRTARLMRVQWITAGIGFVLTLYSDSHVAQIYALVLGVIGVFLYDFWYSKIIRDVDDDPIAIGKQLPNFRLLNNQGLVVESQQWLGQPVIYLFVRGNWCPLCVAQVQEVAAQYQALVARGAKVVLVSAQSEAQSRALAQRFDVPIEFCIDKDGHAAQQLQIGHKGGVALGMQGYAADTLMPTIIICDAEGRIVFSEVADNYRVRPEPELFIEVLDQIAMSTSASADLQNATN